MFFRNLFLLALSFISLSHLFPLLSQEEGTSRLFRYNNQEGDRYRIHSRVEESVFKNWEELYKTEIVNRLSVEIQESDLEKSKIKISYDIAEKKESGSYEIIEKSAATTFVRDRQGGIVEIDKEALYPQLRNIPYFVDRKIAVGEKWYYSAIDVQDLKEWLGESYRIELPFTVDYTYLGESEYKGKEVARIKIEYRYEQQIEKILPESYHAENSLKSLESKAQIELLWDTEKGRELYSEGRFQYSFITKEGERFDFTGHSIGEVIEAQELQDERTIVEEKIEQNNLGSSAVVELTREGLRISLQDIQFRADSIELLPGQEEKLLAVRKILEGYPNRSLLVRGHSQSTGNPKAELNLSAQRAQVIANYLSGSGILQPQNIITEGVGSSQPIELEKKSNLNRRVEIFIQEN